MHINSIIADELTALRQQVTANQRRVDLLVVFEETLRRQAMSLASRGDSFVIHSASISGSLELSIDELAKIIEILKVMRGTAATQAHEAFMSFDITDAMKGYTTAQITQAATPVDKTKEDK